MGLGFSFISPKTKKSLNLKMEGSGHRKFTPIMDGLGICLENLQAHQRVYVQSLILDFFYYGLYPGCHLHLDKPFQTLKWHGNWSKK